MRRFHNPTLVISAASKVQWPESELPEVILCGRSNVGKSSFINAILNRKNLAYVGQTPGKTRLLNFYNLDDQWMLTDAPGYGYAKRSKSEHIDYGKLMEDYFRNRKPLKMAVLLVDIRHNPTQDDLVMLQFIRDNNIPYIVVATKADKLSYSQQLKQVKMILDKLQLDEKLFFPYSASSKKGVEPIVNQMEIYLG